MALRILKSRYVLFAAAWGVYTPQMVIDGSLHFSGAATGLARDEIARAGHEAETAALDASVSLTDDAAEKRGFSNTRRSSIGLLVRNSQTAKCQFCEVWDGSIAFLAFSFSHRLRAAARRCFLRPTCRHTSMRSK